MKKSTAFALIMLIAVCGVLFSGYLSYNELFVGGCKNGFIKCGDQTGPIMGLPSCVYGFVMYCIVFVISLLGYKSKN